GDGDPGLDDQDELAGDAALGDDGDGDPGLDDQDELDEDAALGDDGDGDPGLDDQDELAGDAALGDDGDGDPGLDDQDELAGDAALGDDDDGDIDALFARIRASRSEAVDDAHDVLAESVDPTGSEPDGAVDVESVDGGDETSVVDEVVAVRDTLLAEVSPGLARKLKRALADDQNQILDTLRRHTRGVLQIEAVLPDETEQRQAYARTATDVVVQVSEAGAAQVGGSAGSVEEVLDHLSAQITEPLRARIAGIVAESSDDAEEASSRVRSLFREWRSQVIDGATTDALLGAFSLGAYDATPDGSLVRWVIVDEACPDAHDNVLAGDLVRGERFPTGQCRGPAHPGCRCLSWPAGLLDEEGLEGVPTD
ncbi:MAG: hypothetical protein GY929_00155, partial [Actinomycetia bacterium]|nr:hypothetical protein [Actinomycetes bacterium]